MSTLQDFPFSGIPAAPPKSTPSYADYVPTDELDLEKELVSQYNKAQRILFEAEHSDGTPLNQKAQAINAAAAILAQLTRSQADLYSSERFKKIEAVLLETLKAFPEMQEVFMQSYREALE